MENAENALILLYDLCRLCLDEPGVDNIFEPVDWSQDILFYTGIKVTTLDRLPQSICNSCRDIMNCAKILKDIAHANETRLQEITGLGDANQSELNSSAEPSSSDQNYRNRLVFESDDETPSKKSHKQSQKKRKSSSTAIAPKAISIRTDLFDSSKPVVSEKRRIEFPSSTSSLCKDHNDKKAPSSESPSMKKCKQSPTSTSSNEPTKIVKVKGKELGVHEYAFKCETCNKTYATYKKLYFHQMAHNKKFQCPLDVCCKKFATKGDLQKHIRSHTGEKPFKCDLCDLSFTQNVTLKSHKKSIHNEPS